MTHTHWVSCQRGSLAITAFQFPSYFAPLLHVQLSIFTCLGCMATETYWNYILYISYGLWELTTAWSESSSSTTHQTRTVRILHPLWRSQACERFKMADIPTQLANSCSFLALFVVAAQSKHTSAIWESSWKNTKKNLRRINGFMLQMQQTYHDALIFGHNTKHLQLWF